MRVDDMCYQAGISMWFSIDQGEGGHACIDRLAPIVADHAMIRVLLEQRGIHLASVVENLDESVSDQLVENLMAAVAEFHSSNFCDETRKGMRQKVLQGGWPHLPPRAYRVERDGIRSRIVLDAIEGPLMAEAFGLFASGWYSVGRQLSPLDRMTVAEKAFGPDQDVGGTICLRIDSRGA